MVCIESPVKMIKTKTTEVEDQTAAAGGGGGGAAAASPAATAVNDVFISC